MEDRPTRWQKAKADTEFLRWRREAVAGAVVGILSFVVLKVAGSPGSAMDELMTVAVSVIAVLILLPLSELVWNWLQAPMRLLTQDVVAIRECVEKVRPAPRPDTPQDRAARIAATLIKGELEELRFTLQTLLAHASWTGAIRFSTSVWDERNADLAAHPAFSDAHAKGRIAYRFLPIIGRTGNQGDPLSDLQKKTMEGAIATIEATETILGEAAAGLGR